MNIKNIKSEILSLSLVILSVLSFKSVIACNYTVPTGSMRSTIEIGDKIIVNKMAYDFRIPFTKIKLFEVSQPKRGDIIVFESPQDPSMTLVKRLIGLPGDRIDVYNGMIRLNGKPLQLTEIDSEGIQSVLSNGGFYQESLEGKNYKVRRTSRKQFPLPPQAFTVPADHYFAMGDNRDESSDGRHWGFFPAENLWGQAKFVYFSADWPQIRWDRAGLILI